ncbi:MAG TPA: hypothetical protein VIF34_13485 [Methylocystis sp.]|jgi:hypothetical protein
MRRVLFIALLLASVVSGQSLAQDSSKSPKDRVNNSSDGVAAIEFSGATGKPLGSVTKIGGTTYYFGADGTMLGTSTMVEGRRVFRSY